MESYNQNDNSAATSRTGRFIIIFLIIMVLIFGYLWARTLSRPKVPPTQEVSSKYAEEHRILMISMLLHSQFSALQQLDEQAVNIGTSIEPTLHDDLNNRIIAQETAFRKSIDSVEKETAKINAWANVVMIDSITSSFKRALNNRVMMENFREAVNSKTETLSDDQKNFLQLQFDLQQKDQQIAQLQRALTSAPARVSREDDTKSSGSSEELKAEEIRNAGLLDVTNGLKEENKRLQDELKKIRSSITYNQTAASSAASRTSALQEQVAQLTSDLNFAKINCNLIRADANRAVTTSKQRKDLLAEAMQSLQELSVSDNIAVQQRAREKMRELNAISASVRD